jgi:amino-acid N-acetyltransferase
MTGNLQIRAALERDWREISQVLESCGLPHDDAGQSPGFFHVAVLGDGIVGCACAERYDQTVVVRSVAVREGYYDPQIAIRLVGALLTRACAQGCTKAVVVTADEHTPFWGNHSTLGSTDSLPEAVKLSKGLLRRFGAMTHDNCRR